MSIQDFFFELKQLYHISSGRNKSSLQTSQKTPTYPWNISPKTTCFMVIIFVFWCTSRVCSRGLLEFVFPSMALLMVGWKIIGFLNARYMNSNGLGFSASHLSFPLGLGLNSTLTYKMYAGGNPSLFKMTSLFAGKEEHLIYANTSAKKTKQPQMSTEEKNLVVQVV